MRNASSRFISYAAAGNLPSIKALLIDSNGNEQWLSGNDFISNTVSFKNETSSDNSFDVGAVIISSFTFSLNNFQDKFEGYNFVGAEIDAYIGYTFDDQTEEYLRMGHYYLVTHKTVGNIINCTAYDALALMDENQASLSFTSSITVAEAVRQLATARGITLANQTWPNSTYAISEADFPTESMTERQLLQYLVQICGCYARINDIGYLYIGWYGSTATYTDPTIFSHTLYTSDVNITGVRVTGDDDLSYLYGTSGYVLVIDGNPFVNENTIQTIASNIGASVIGMTFRPGSIDVLSSPVYEVGDIFSIEDAKGNRCTFYATSVTYSNKLKEQIRCGAETEEINDLRPSALTVHAERLKKEIYRNISDYDTSYQALANLLSSGMGLYETVEDAPAGGVIIYYHDKPLLSESQVIWKATADAFGVSTDGGQTWSAGVTASGNILANVLTAIGVNADWIRAGLLEDSTHTNWWDLDRGIFHISADTAQQIAEYVDAASGWYFATPYSRDEDNVAHFRAFLKNGDEEVTYNYEPYCYQWYARDDYSQWRVGVGYTLDYDLDEMPYGVTIICTFKQMGYYDLCTHLSEEIVTKDGDGIIVLSDETRTDVSRLEDGNSDAILTNDNYEIGLWGRVEGEEFTVETDFTAGRKTAQLSVTVDGLVSEMTEITEEQENLSSRIEQTAGAITTEVNRATAAEGTLSSRIEQTATSISFTVTNPIASGNSALLAMSYTREDGTTISLASQNITFTGMVRFVDLSGNNRGTTVINGNNISTGSIHDANNNTVFNLTDGSLTIKKGSITLGSTPSASATGFTVSSSGVLQASDAVIWGTIYASEGTIGGLTLNDGKLYTNNKNTRDSATTGVYIASDGIAIGNTASDSSAGFRVDNAGNVKIYGGTLSAGTITGGTITGGAISGGTVSGTVIYSSVFRSGDPQAGTLMMEINSTSGYVYCHNFHIVDTYGNTCGGFEIDIDTSYYNANRKRIQTGHGIHTLASEDDAWSWFEQGVRFDRYPEFGSDRRMKEDIKPLDAETVKAFVMQLNPVSFHMLNDRNPITHHGLIAQEVHDLIKDSWALVTVPDQGMMGISYMELIADLITVVQDQERRIKALENT